MIRVTATQVKNNFGKYLEQAQKGDDIIILKNGKEVGRLISSQRAVNFLTDQLAGSLKNDVSEKMIREQRLKKYEDID